MTELASMSDCEMLARFVRGPLVRTVIFWPGPSCFLTDCQTSKACGCRCSGWSKSSEMYLIMKWTDVKCFMTSIIIHIKRHWVECLPSRTSWQRPSQSIQCVWIYKSTTSKRDSIRIVAAKGWAALCSSIAKTDWNVVTTHHMQNVINNIDASAISPAVSIDQNSLKMISRVRFVRHSVYKRKRTTLLAEALIL